MAAKGIMCHIRIKLKFSFLSSVYLIDMYSVSNIYKKWHKVERGRERTIEKKREGGEIKIEKMKSNERWERKKRDRESLNYISIDTSALRVSYSLEYAANVCG